MAYHNAYDACFRTAMHRVPPHADLDLHETHRSLKVMAAYVMHVSRDLGPRAMQWRHKARHGHVPTRHCSVKHYH